MKPIRIIKKILFEIALLTAGENNSYKVYSKLLGVTFGSNVRITGRINFGSEPFLVTIGDNVTITSGVQFITHDGGVGIFRKEFPGINVYGKIRVGNNVFIGINSIILPGVTIGNNVVIGVSTVVTKNTPDNVIVAGIPGKVIRTIDEYKANSLKKAVLITEKDPAKRKQIILNATNQKE